MKKIILTGLLFLVSTSFAQSYYADLSNPEDLVNPSNYYEYKIVKGDCLWFISDDFYGDPYNWTIIHEANPYIINPDWIYPNNWLVIPNIFADENGNPIVGAAVVSQLNDKSVDTEDSDDKTSTGLIAKYGVDTNGDGMVDESAGIDIDGDGVVDGYDVDGDGKIDIEVGSAIAASAMADEIMDDSETTKLEKHGVDADGSGVIGGIDLDGNGNIDIESDAELTKEITKSSVSEVNKESAATASIAIASGTEMRATDEMADKEDKEHKKCKEPCECKKVYCGKPGWKLGLHAGFPLASAPEDESLNVGVLLGTPLGVKAGPFYVGLGAGAFTYNFEDLYIGGGVLASLCINELLKLDMPLMLQIHGAGYYVFGDESGPGFGLIGSGSLPIGDSPLSLGVYVGVGQYYPDEKDFTWGNAGAVLYYNF